MSATTKEHAIVVTGSHDDSTIERIEMEVDRTRRPLSPERRKQLEAFLKRKSPKKKRKK